MLQFIWNIPSQLSKIAICDALICTLTRLKNPAYTGICHLYFKPCYILNILLPLKALAWPIVDKAQLNCKPMHSRSTSKEKMDENDTIKRRKIYSTNMI